MKWISGLKPKFENQVQTWKWKAEFQVYFKKSSNRPNPVLENEFNLESKSVFRIPMEVLEL